MDYKRLNQFYMEPHSQTPEEKDARLWAIAKKGLASKETWLLTLLLMLFYGLYGC